MSDIALLLNALAIAVAILLLRYTRPHGLVDCIALLIVVLGGVLGVFALAQEFTTDRAVYELETGEYLHCTPQGGNHLTCEVTHRKDNQ
ncbi:hypothetical protein [Corynebacterium lujinxingii]|uniref:Uncharacterized protein n=1 Tax=Corynebacterium lujinxingii TaxID=2763010 RepID=A0A7H0K0Q7_9CORY|nr:hypothetical protein [Corynebacterium lujinxingii]MBC3179382.1 hypothetical protein [Corynebacterium lujinxingii]NNO11490.1 hypothetical protein [Corynebacterium lujinxingii]QNP90873.1 hypothetical protein IAU68_03660 [Corynebacterium lujinxingii]